MTDHYKTLCERRDWLKERIEAKKKIGWEIHWDEREYAALVWATQVLDWASGKSWAVAEKIDP